MWIFYLFFLCKLNDYSFVHSLLFLISLDLCLRCDVNACFPFSKLFFSSYARRCWDASFFLMRV